MQALLAFNATPGEGGKKSVIQQDKKCNPGSNSNHCSHRNTGKLGNQCNRGCVRNVVVINLRLSPCNVCCFCVILTKICVCREIPVKNHEY
jgi:hypothetical protein